MKIVAIRGKKVEITENMSVEDILKASLKYLSFL